MPDSVDTLVSICSEKHFGSCHAERGLSFGEAKLSRSRSIPAISHGPECDKDSSTR